MMRKHSYQIISFICAFLHPAVAQKVDWPYDDYYGENMVYIHAIANYELHPFWHEKWEKNLFRQNMMRLNFASISNTELLSDVRLAINEELFSGLWFRYAATYYATHHRNEQDRQIATGFEKKIHRPLSIFIYGDPHFEKEEIDVQYGLSLADENRSTFLRLAFVDVDVFWNDKNNLQSRDLKKPWQFVWETNVMVGPFRFFSQGRYDGGGERSFAAREGRDRMTQQKKIDDLICKLYFYRTQRSFVEAAYSLYHFTEAKAFDGPDFDYSYDNRIELVKFGYTAPVGENYCLRFGAHAVIQDADATGYGEHHYRHAELIPFFFAERRLGSGIVEAGYMGSMQKWDYVGAFRITHPHRQGYIDKIKLAYTFNFDRRVYLQFAISHVTTIWGFGGGNVQFWMEF